MSGSTAPSPAGSTLVAIPVFGAPELTDSLLSDLAADEPPIAPAPRVVVVDNAGDYDPGARPIELFRPEGNLRWIGATNWGLQTALDGGFSTCVVLNNDIRLSPGFLSGLLAPFAELADVAVVAACYDDFWLHQRASVIPETAADYRPVRRFRRVPFCDGTAIAFSVAAVARVGLLDRSAFPEHGYGSDLDFALRAQDAGLSCVVSEAAYVSHLRRGTMNRIGRTSEQNRAEILGGLDAKWGDTWRARLGLGPGAFPAHNTGSGADWYLEPPTGA